MGSNRVTVGTALPTGSNSIGQVTANAGTNLNTSALATEATLDARTGILTETAPATDTASSGLNGRLQRIAQRLTSLIALLPTALGAGGGLKVDGSGTALPVSGTVAVSTALALDATLGTTNTDIGGLTETAPTTDTASSGLNGRLQRIAQRLTSLIAVFTIGAGTEAAAVRVTLPTDGTGKVNAAQSGTWTVQPGNTANTTAWKVDGSAVTQPVSGTVTANAGTGTFTVDSELPAAAALADGASATPSTPTVGAIPLLMNATTEDRARAVVNALDSTGTGIAAAGIVGQFDDTSTGAVTENQFAPVRISTRRALLVEGVASGTAQPVSQATASSLNATVVGTGTFAVQATLAAGAAAIAKAEDVASADADVGVPAMAVRKATPANTSGTDGDYEMLQVSAGRLWASATIDAALPTGTNTIGAVTQAGSATNASGQVTISNTSATVIASRAGRRGVLLVNNQTVSVYLDAAGGTATTSKFRIDPGASVFLPVTSAVTGITSAAYTASPADAQIHYTELY